MRTLATSQLLLAGAWFAEAQVSVLFLLQTYYTASIQAYLLLITAWLCGAILGVWITSPIGPLLWLVSAAASFGILQIWTTEMPLPIELTWILIFMSAIPAGQLYQEQIKLWPSSGTMFSIEAVGFTIGLLVATLLLMNYGIGFCRTLPGQALALSALSFMTWRRART